MASVAFENVEKVYPNGTVAVCDCSLQVADGELMVFVGPSGCGKTTLLRLLAGLDAVTSGTLRIGGRIVNDLTPQQRNVAMVFQDYALYPFLSVRRNLEFPLRMRRLSATEIGRQVDAVAEILGIGALLDRLPRELSGGQRQRVAMGRALVRHPAVSLLDEPLSNLDARLRIQVRAEIADLQRRTDTTMVYVTHDQVEAMTLGHRVAVMNHGRLQQVAGPRDLYERPANTFVAGFIGNPSMNLFPTVLMPGAVGELRLRVGDQCIDLAREVRPERDRTVTTAGIRPESFRLHAGDRPSLWGRVAYVEYLGHETLAHVGVGTDAEGPRLVVRLAGTHDLHPGGRIGLDVPPSAVHLFDREGQAVTAG
ncbi:ATP-binding cassette domain-containing protein [Candidatus Binatia bacterium]|nr:ATP-binding cassette domain-containing protein [Candidatus Binatia bacterium]